MNFIFFVVATLKNLKKHEFHFLQALKTSENMNFIFCKLKKPQWDNRGRYGRILLHLRSIERGGQSGVYLWL